MSDQIVPMLESIRDKVCDDIEMSRLETFVYVNLPRNENAKTWRTDLQAALNHAYAQGQRAGWEEAAKITESEVLNAETDSFCVNHQFLTNQAGHDRFVSTIRVRNLLRQRAAAIRALNATAEDRG